MPFENNVPKVIVIGGGLVGPLCVCFLAKLGYNIELYECREREDMGLSKTNRGKSINLALSHRGREALRLVGLEELILESAIPMKGRLLHGLNGETKSVPYDKRSKQCIYSIGRNRLNEVLLAACQKLPNVKLYFHHKLVSANLDEARATFLQNKTNNQIEVQGDLIVGADGAHSVLRNAMLSKPLFDFQQAYIPHGYLELRVGPENSHVLTPNHLHIWPRGQFMMIALPNPDSTWTLTLFMPFERFEELSTPNKLIEFFEKVFPDAVSVIGTDELVEDFFKKKPSCLISIKCDPYNTGRAILIGDAAHAMVPFYGQGMNAGFEDCIILSKLLEEFKGDFDLAIREFTSRRKDDAQAICDLAMYNYVEMRDLVTRKTYYARKLLDEFLYWVMPDVWIPLYNTVSFSRMRYKECIENRKWQDKVIKIVFIALIAFLSLTFFIVGHIAF